MHGILPKSSIPTHFNDPLGNAWYEDWRMKTYDWFYAEFPIGHQSCPLQVHGSSYHERNKKELNDAIFRNWWKVSQIRLKANNLGQFRDREDTTKKSLKGLFTFDGSMIFNLVFCGAQPRPKLNQRKFIVYFFFCNLGAWALHTVSYVTADTMQYTFSLPFLYRIEYVLGFFTIVIKYLKDLCSFLGHFPPTQ